MNMRIGFPLVLVGLGGSLFWESLSSGHTVLSAIVIGSFGVAFVTSGLYLQQRLFYHQPKA